MLVLIGEVALSVLFFVSYSKPELLTELNMSEAFFKKAIMSYREDLDQQNFIDSIQQKVSQLNVCMKSLSTSKKLSSTVARF